MKIDAPFLYLDIAFDHVSISFGQIGLILLFAAMGVASYPSTPILIALSAPFLILFAIDPNGSKTFSLGPFAIDIPGLTKGQRKVAAERRHIRQSQPPMTINESYTLRMLGLTWPATSHQIEVARRHYAFANHPDKIPASQREKATQALSLVNAGVDRLLVRAGLSC